VKNFEELQANKNRPTNPWIRLYVRIIDDKDFMDLPDGVWRLAVCLWLLASQTNNRIPNIPENIAWRLHNGVDAVIDGLSTLCQQGFIELITDCQQDDTLEERRGEESREDVEEKREEKRTTRAACPRNGHGAAYCPKCEDDCAYVSKAENNGKPATIKCPVCSHTYEEFGTDFLREVDD